MKNFTECLGNLNRACRRPAKVPLLIIAFAAVIAFAACDDDTTEPIPSVPTGVNAVVTSSTSITVSWSAVSNADGYYVYRSESADGTYTLEGYPSSTTSYINKWLSEGTTYYYKVSAYNYSSGESAQSSYASATTSFSIPRYPYDVEAEATSLNSITVSWDAVSNAAGYYVYRSESYSGTYTRVGTTSTASYTDTGLSQETTYYYRVTAYNSTGESAQTSYAISATTLRLPAPTDVNVAETSLGSITVSWTAVSDADGYYVYRSDPSSGGGNGNYTRIGDSSTASYTDTVSLMGMTYYYKVSAYNSGKESYQSSYASVKTSRSIPKTPTGVSASATSLSSITVSWTAVYSDNSYIVYRSSSADGTYTRVGISGKTSYTDTGLSANTTYYYKVSAVSYEGESPQSSYASATTGSSSGGGGGGGGGGGTSSVSGTYRSGFQVVGNFTFNSNGTFTWWQEGNWSQGGTYQVSGSSITITWSAGGTKVGNDWITIVNSTTIRYDGYSFYKQ